MFRKGEKVRLAREVSTFFVNPDHEYAGIDYEEYARIHEPLLLRAGIVAQFESYLKKVEGLAVVTPWNAETETCGILLGWRDFYRVDVPTDALRACAATEPLTPLAACAEGLPANHHFRTADKPET
jgi:hypothetical protein